jgi:hypothetical protein
MAHPGKQLTFMGTEFGQWKEWSEARSLDWNLLEYPEHQKLQECVKTLIIFISLNLLFIRMTSIGLVFNGSTIMIRTTAFCLSSVDQQKTLLKQIDFYFQFYADAM